MLLESFEELSRGRTNGVYTNYDNLLKIIMLGIKRVIAFSVGCLTKIMNIAVGCLLCDRLLWGKSINFSFHFWPPFLVLHKLFQHNINLSCFLHLHISVPQMVSKYFEWFSVLIWFLKAVFNLHFGFDGYPQNSNGLCHTSAILHIFLSLLINIRHKPLILAVAPPSARRSDWKSGI